MKNSINIAVIGLGGRGSSMLDTICLMEDVNVIGVCDKYEDRTNNAVEKVKKLKSSTPFGSQDYKEILALDGLDSIYIATDWEMHTEIAIEAMKLGINPAFEVGGAYTIDECWELVDTYEKTGTWGMMMENCCYGERELMIHNMVRQGLFGKVVACSGKYAHDLRGEIGNGNRNRHYRLRNYLARNCENYPTHELGPIAKLLDINRGNRFVSLISVCSGSYGMNAYVNKEKKLKPELGDKEFAQADIFKTFIETERGELIELTLDTSLPRFYSRGFTVRGTKAMYQEDGDAIYFDKPSFAKNDFTQQKFWGRAKRYKKKYDHPLWANTTEEMMKSGHGGIDYLVIRAWVESVKNDTLPPIDIYDAASWMCITPLSEVSVKNGSSNVEIPDFTRGKYKNREDHAQGDYEIK